MSWNWCGCCKPQREDVHQLDYQHLGLKEVPVDVFVHERTLEELNLEANRVTELPRALFHCHGLRIVNLSDNDISVVPPAIASLINLQHLNLSKNSLCDIPDNIKCCKQLLHINLSVNPLEKLPDGFTQLIALEEVYLNDTFLDFLPANFGRLSKLRVLDVRENNLNTLPKSIARLCNLQILDIGKNEFSDLPEVVGNLPVLTELWADFNRIRCIPQFIGNLTKLSHLDLSNNNVNWISGSIEKCVNLHFLALTGNELQAIPDEIGNLRELGLLKVDDNDIASMPSSLGKLTNLNELVASQNILEALPANIGLLRKLEVLNVDDNRLTALPPELGSCSSLRILSVRNNCLENFPAELGHLASISVINVADNFLRNLPVSILKLDQLTALWLSTNQTTPLTTLQQEIDPSTGQMVCVNFMFPQVDQERNLDEFTVVREPSRAAGPRIRFADNTELLHPSRLTRAPTPYPKELRTMAKHARILATQSRIPSNVEENVPLLDKMQVGTATPVKIKLATVTKPSTTTLVEPMSKDFDNTTYQVVAGHEDGSGKLPRNSNNLPDVLDLGSACDQSVPLSEDSDGGSLMNDYLDQSCDFGFTKQCNLGNVYKVDFCDHISVDSVANEEPPEPTIEECRVERNNTPPESLTELSVSKLPPPYHIAAAYSKQAAYFKNHSMYSYEGDVSQPTQHDEPQGNSDQSPVGCSGSVTLSDSPDPPVISHGDADTEVDGKYSNEDVTQTGVYLQSFQATQITLPEQNEEEADAYKPTSKLVEEDKIFESTFNTSYNEAATPDEYILNNYENQLSFENDPSPLHWQQISANELSLMKPSTEECATKLIEMTSISEKPVSKIPFLKSKLPHNISKSPPVPSQQSRMLQPGFYVGRQHGPDSKTDVSPKETPVPAFVSKIPTTVKTSPTRGSHSVPESPVWLFGQHRNPTVFPVVIKKNPGLGFTIGGGTAIPGHSDKQGIFITKVNPNGPAGNYLSPGDKILEVDGIDFSKLGHESAVAILKQCKQVVNMMVSRQK